MTSLPLGAAAARVLCEALSYPDAGLPGRVRAGAAALAPAGAAAVIRLAERLDRLGPAAAEELYTSTFDLRPAVSPYLGHHLCGEGPRRNALLSWLAERYAAAGLAAGPELPDHVAEVLRWIGHVGADPDAAEVAGLALRPAARLIRAALPLDNPYRDALDALVAALEPCAAEEVAP